MRLGMLLVLASLSFSGGAAGDCIDYGGDYIRVVGSSPFASAGFEQDIEVSGTVAYLGNEATLQTFDISNPTAPTLLASSALTGGGTGTHRATGVTVVGSTAYVTNAYAGLFLVNVSNPAAPSILGRVDTPGVAEDVAVAGNRAYVADFEAGLQVIDLSNPAAPIIIGSVDTPANAFGVSLYGTIAYVADGLSGVQVIDVSNPMAPVIVGSISTPGAAQDIASVGSLLYVADGTYGLVVIDASNPTSPMMVGYVDTPGYAWDLRVQGTLAYVANDSEGLLVVDVSNPTLPTVAGKKHTPGKAKAIAVSGTTAFVVDQTFGDNHYGGLQVIDVTNLASPPIVGSVLIDPTATATTVSVGWPLACVADGGLAVLDISNPASPVKMGKVYMPSSGQNGQLASSQDVVLVGRTAYVSYVRYTGYTGLATYDLSIPAYPQALSQLEVPGGDNTIGGVAISGTRGFLCAGDKLLVLDVSDRYPVILGTLSGVSAARKVAAHGSMAYLISAEPGGIGKLRVIDVSNPAVPTILGTATIPGFVLDGIAVSGPYAYVAVRGSGNNYPSGFRVVQISTPQSPTVIGGMDLVGLFTKSVAISGTHLFAAAGAGGVHVINVSNPTAPALIGYLDVLAGAVTVSGSWAYVTTGPSGLAIGHAQCPAETAVIPQEPPSTLLGPAVPNPSARGETRIPFTVPQKGRVTLRILDIRGREITTLIDRVSEPGTSSIIWDGQDASGEIVPAGIYFYELQVSGAKASRKLTRLH